jgi:hypothetical protein
MAMAATGVPVQVSLALYLACGELIAYGFEICRNCDAEPGPVQPDG